MPHTSAPSIVPALLVPYLAWRVYRRFHRNVGRQPMRKSRLVVGIVLFAVISVLLLAFVYRSVPLLSGLGGGLAIGAVLGFVGLSLTRFETESNGRRFYTPNTYIGVGLTLLLAGRILYRLGVLYFFDTPGDVAPAAMQSPLTLLIIGLTAGYYITYNSGVLIRK